VCPGRNPDRCARAPLEQLGGAVSPSSVRARYLPRAVKNVSQLPYDRNAMPGLGLMPSTKPVSRNSVFVMSCVARRSFWRRFGQRTHISWLASAGPPPLAPTMAGCGKDSGSGLVYSVELGASPVHQDAGVQETNDRPFPARAHCVAVRGPNIHTWRP